MGSKQLRRIIRKILVETFNSEEMEKIKVLMTSGCSHINMVDVMMEPQEFEDLYLDISMTRPSWVSICEELNHDGDVQEYPRAWGIRGDAVCKKFFQRGFELTVNPQTLMIEEASCTWWEYVAYWDGDTDWEDVTPNEPYEWAKSLTGKKFTPLFACQIVEEHDALNRKYPQK